MQSQWNSLPLFRSQTAITSIRKKLKTHLVRPHLTVWLSLLGNLHLGHVHIDLALYHLLQLKYKVQLSYRFLHNACDHVTFLSTSIICKKAFRIYIHKLTITNPFCLNDSDFVHLTVDFFYQGSFQEKSLWQGLLVSPEFCAPISKADSTETYLSQMSQL